jgi:hypothetical protein
MADQPDAETAYRSFLQAANARCRDEGQRAKRQQNQGDDPVPHDHRRGRSGRMPDRRRLLITSKIAFTLEIGLEMKTRDRNITVAVSPNTAGRYNGPVRVIAATCRARRHPAH